ncbi:carboxypeptidase regulatory-like domain-containing protein [bacterium]|nr:carboxypeptidase regulatory-like domain-containing protein [bacterium]
MNRLLMAALLLPCLLLAACGGKETAPRAESALLPAAVLDNAPGTGVFNAALPDEGSFNPQRVSAEAAVSQSGSLFSDSSTNVAVQTDSAQFSPLDSVEYAIWRFYGTPQDALSGIDITVSGAAAGADYWLALADYGSGRWDWLSQASADNGFSETLDSTPGRYSSPAGYIYVAVLTDAAAQFSVDNLTLHYASRYSISGVVLDMADRPLEGVLLTTELIDGIQTHSAADGSFTLSGIPEGSWHLMAALDGYVFIPDALEFTVSGADLNGLLLRGWPDTTQHVADDPYEPNDLYENAFDTAGTPPTAWISVLDDPVDYYEFQVPDEGWYYLQYSGDDRILFPRLELLVDSRITVLSSSPVLSGATWLGFYFPRQGSYIVKFSCEGGGGSYSINLLAGRTESMRLELIDTGASGDGGDGLYEELAVSAVFLEIDGLRARLTSFSNGAVTHSYIPPHSGTITPQSEIYTFDPPSVVHDFAGGPLANQDFNMSATAPADGMEPNDDFPAATPLSLPLSAPVEGWIGGADLTNGDTVDVFSFEVQQGMDLMVRVRFPQNAPHYFPDAGALELYDSAENYISVESYSDSVLHIRTLDPLDAGTYYVFLYMEGPVMPYELEIREFEARFLSADYFLDGLPLLHGTCSFITADQSYSESTTPSDGLVEFYYPFADGERVLVSHQRYGLDFDPPYEWVEFNGSDVLLDPVITLSTDSNEANDSNSYVQELSLPVDINASASSGDDHQDFYVLKGLDGEELEILVDPVDPDWGYEINIMALADGIPLFRTQHSGNLQCWLKAETADDYMVIVSSLGYGESEYQLRVNAAAEPVHRISGTLDPGVPGESTSRMYVVNHTMGLAVLPFADSYSLGWLPAGSYQIEWQGSNKSFVPAGKTTIVLSNADVLQDFTASNADHDFGEPNNNSGSATELTLPASLHATLDDDNDSAITADRIDYYKFTAPTDGAFEITVQPDADWYGGFDVKLSEGTRFNFVNAGKRNPLNGQKLMRYPVKAGMLYYIIVDNADDLEYDLEAGYRF